MSLVFNGVTIPTTSNVYFNGSNIKDVVFNGVNYWSFYQEQLVISISIGGWAFNGTEQINEANTIYNALSSQSLISSWSINSSGADSMARFFLQGNYVVKLDGVNINSNGGFAIDHQQDWIGLSSNPSGCTSGATGNCSTYYSTWGRYNKTLQVFKVI